MNYKTLIFLLFVLFISSCKKNSNLHIPKEIDDLGPEFIESYKNNTLIKTNLKDGKIKLNDTLKIKLNSNKKNLSFEIKTNNQIEKIIPIEIDSNNSEEYKFLMKELSLGVKELIINNDSLSEKINFTLLNDKTPKIYDFEIINEFTRGLDSYTQGFEFYNDTLYESLGQYGKSKLVKVDYKNGNTLKEYNLESKFFAEGITILNNKIYQLTWKEKIGFVYDVNTFELINSFKYNKSLEGWGISNDGKKLYKSDGTEKIWTLNSENQTEEGYIEIYTDKNKVIHLNELEWIDGKIYANRYQFKGMAIINPKNGAVEGVVNLSPLQKKVTQHRKLDVINGIAYNKKRNSIFVTGKMWDKIFEIRIIERK
ncbi:MAG: glutaminyl-peptide cyclotransferase [Flavobacteriaceae bacterium]